ncbi:tudor and KH domain-containing protein homolog isoform X2 [Ostrea edulis]|uniref:tudor and KH domain-containing protein homolog isoform X2 n=1 Tax=Ostrea edulis TaxID=37623 RepID=UPI0024AF007E|nr:tudor and KH domain-containing protein homolog isoform X2 [Ostrea edulis]
MKTLNKILVVAGAVGLTSTAYMLYKLLSDAEDEDDEEEEKRQSATSKQTVIELNVPSKAAGAIIGRQGTKIKEIQKNTGTRINFKEDGRSKEDDSTRTMIIRGTAESAQRAELVIRDFVANMPVILTEVMSVPSSALGRIIGRGGDTIKSISRSSKAKVYVDRAPDDYRVVEQEVQLTGSREQIDLAKTLIQEKVQEEKVFRAKKSVMEANREKRNKSNMNTKQEKREEIPLDEKEPVHTNPSLHQQNVASWPSGRSFVEVYVSSVANPSTFFVQILTSKSMELDEIVKDMSQYYSKERESDVEDDIGLGQLVAAPFDQDSSWYRARVSGFQGDDPDQLDLFYLDYGDSCYLQKSKVRILQSEFMRIPFQAVECELANICPKDGDSWEEAVVDRFEELTHTAMWTVLMAKLVEIKTLSTGEKIHIVELVDTNEKVDVNIATKLCAEGLAKWCGTEKSDA